MSHIEKAFKNIKDAKIKFISLVKNGANKRQFALKKSEDKNEISFDIIKAEKKDWSVVKGVVYEPEKFDTDGHKMSLEEIQKMAHYALKNGLSVDIEHNEKITSNPVVESYIVEKDEKIGNQIAKAGSWIVATEIIESDVKKSIDAGEINCFSMAGKAILEDIEKAESSKAFSSITKEFSDFVDLTMADTEMTEIQKQEDLKFNLGQFEIAMNEKIEKTFKIKKSDKENNMSEQITKNDIAQMIAEGIKANDEAKESNLAKSAEAKEREALTKRVDALTEELTKSKAGKDGAEDLEKSDKTETSGRW